jgi:hypothetical protein
MVGLEWVRCEGSGTGDRTADFAERVTTVAAVAGAILGAVGGAAAASMAGGFYTAAGSVGAMLGSGCAAALAWCVVPRGRSHG